jgi:hypothetical protein
MTRTTLILTSTFAVLVSVGALGIGAAVDMPSTLMSPADYDAAKRGIESRAAAAIGQCRQLQGAARDVCKAEARAEERVRQAELGARYHGTVSATQDLRMARVKALYDVARARCGDRGGEERLQCLRAARDDRRKSLEGQHLADAT